MLPLSDRSGLPNRANAELHPQVLQILDRIADACLMFDRQWKICYLNRQAEQALQVTPAKILGKTIWECQDFLDAVGTALLQTDEREQAPTAVEFEVFHSRLKKWFEVRSHPSPEGLSVFLRDITQHKQDLAQLQLLEKAIAASNNGIVISDTHAPDRPIIYCNQAFQDLTGYDRSEIIGHNCRFLQGPDTDKTVVDAIRTCIREQRHGRFTLKNYHKDGTPFWNELTLSPVRDRTGEVTHYIGVQNDITERKQAQEALRQSEAKFQKLAANLPGTIYQFRLSADGQKSFPYISPRCREVYEIEPEAVQHNADLILAQIHPEDRPSFDETVRISAQTLEPWQWEGRLITASGKLKWIQAASRPELQPNGDILWDGLLIDISEQQAARLERQLAEEKLRKSEANLAEAQKVAHIGSWEYDILTASLSWSEEMFRIFGLDPAQPIPSYVEQLQQIHPADREQWVKTAEHSRTEGTPYELDFRIFRPDGSIRYIHAKGQPTTNQQGQVTRLFGTVLDITEVKRTEAALRQHIQMLDLANDTIMILALNGTITYWNHGAENLYGWTKQEALGQNAHTLLKTVWTESLEAAKSICLRQGYWQGELIHSRWDGQQITVSSRWTLQRDENGEPAAILEINNDISDRKQAENALRESERREREKAFQLEQTLRQLQRTQAQLVQYEKMMSLGQLVAGLAHEINNPVSFIYSNLTYAHSYAQDLLALVDAYQQNYPNPVPAVSQIAQDIDLEFLATDFPKILDSMKVGAERIRQIVLSLRNFSRLDESYLKTVDLHEGIESTLQLLQYRLKSQADRAPIEVIKEYGDLPRVQCYPGQLNQIFMNLLNNAIDALEQGVSARFLHAKEELESLANPLHPVPTIRIRTNFLEGKKNSPPRVIVRIADNGPGFREDVKRRLFDPFFSTKPVGKGTGLGLSICYQVVVEQHKGDIRCISAPGLGAEFIIEIPIRQQQPYPSEA